MDRSHDRRGVEELDWEHSYERTPYENLKALVEELPDSTPERRLTDLAFKHICGYGPESAPRALEAIRDELERESGE